MVYRPHIDQELCFVIMPLTEPYISYYETIIKKCLIGMKLKPIRADEIYAPRMIMENIWRSLWTCRIAIADVRKKNPNVNYELGLCHAIGVPTIIISENIQDVPFDYCHIRCIIYNPNDIGWEQRLSDNLKKTVDTVLSCDESNWGLLWPYETYSTDKFLDGSIWTVLTIHAIFSLLIILLNLRTQYQTDSIAAISIVVATMAFTINVTVAVLTRIYVRK